MSPGPPLARAPGKAESERGRGEKDAARKDADSASFSYRRVKQARKREVLPDPIREEVTSCGRLLTELFGPVFVSHPRLKFVAARLFAAQLPPLPRPPGRPGYRQVSEAIRLRDEVKRLHPELSLKQIWRMIYPDVIPNYCSLPPPERRDAEDQLRRRTHWRLAARRRRQRPTAIHQL
jgi:hypothetical protein